MTGLAYAINRAYHAWVRTQPQLTLDLWGDGLDETQGFECRSLRLVEPTAATLNSPGGGLTVGAEPGHTLLRGTDALPCVAPPGTDDPGGSAPLSVNGPRPHDLDGMRGRGQRRTV